MPTKPPAKKVAPAKKAMPAKKATPVKKAVPTRKPAPAKKAAPARKSAPAKRALTMTRVVWASWTGDETSSTDEFGGSSPKPQFRVYVMRVTKNDPRVKFDFYVGSTKKSLGEKWNEYSTLSEEYLSRKFLSGRVTALGFVREFMNGWGPYESDDLVKFAEGELALHLKDLGYAVHSDQLKPAIQRRKEFGVFEVPVWNSRTHKKLAKQAGDIRRAVRKEREVRRRAERDDV